MYQKTVSKWTSFNNTVFIVLIFLLGKLKGMNENSSTVELSSGHADEKAIVQYVYEAANVVQVQSNDKDNKILRLV